MKRICVLALMVVFLAAAAMAEEVKSVNVVGYVRVEGEAGNYDLLGIQFDDLDVLNPTVTDMFGTSSVPDSTQVYIFNGTGYNVETFYGPGWWGWDPGTNVLDRVTGLWLYAPQNHTYTLCGEVPDYDTPIQLNQGYQLMCYPYPAGVALSNTVMGANAQDSDQIYVFDGSTYVDYTYYAGYGWYEGANPAGGTVLEVGSGFWYYKYSGSTNLTETKPYTL